jgi:hypothetical protein
LHVLDIDLDYLAGVVATDFGLNSVHAEGGKGPNNRTMPGADLFLNVTYF